MTVLEAYLGPLSQCLTPDVARRIVDYRPDERTQERLDYLRTRANDGLLSEAERAEYQEFVETLDFVGLLKDSARALLGTPKV
ncbi:MAG: hypothetical protein K8T25_14560 [Planctomycetia bacterium]|nr:hypothetical protein [Planctomycetia bacterium]